MFDDNSKSFTIQDYNRVYGEIAGLKCLIDKLPDMISEEEKTRFYSLAGDDYQVLLNAAIDALLSSLKERALLESKSIEGLAQFEPQLSVAQELRNKKSFYNRELLDRAARAIESLAHRAQLLWFQNEQFKKSQALDRKGEKNDES